MIIWRIVAREASRNLPGDIRRAAQERENRHLPADGFTSGLTKMKQVQKRPVFKQKCCFAGF
jgi:hypothetical protein